VLPPGDVHLSECGCILNYTLELDHHKKVYRQVTFADRPSMYSWLSDEWPAILVTHSAWITRIDTDIPVMFEDPPIPEEQLNFIDSTPYEELNRN